MDTFARQAAEERATYFQEAAARMSLPPHVIEKDFWVCWTLKRLFALESVRGNLLFKGGTSLSKVYGLIHRFSEDIDLSIHRGSLGFDGNDDPANTDLSNKARKRQSEALTIAARQQVISEILPELEQVIRGHLNADSWSLEPDPSDRDGLSLAFQYPQSSLTLGTDSYLKPAVKIEFGARSAHWPAETKSVKPYLSEAIPDSLSEPETALKSMSATRTFWEKATILHQTAHLPEGKPFPPRYSRHYCDLASMIDAGIGDLAAQDTALLKAVVAHKMAFYRSAWASYETAAKGSICLLPADDRLAELASDFQSMNEMFFGSPPDFDAVLATIQVWQDGFNHTVG